MTSYFCGGDLRLKYGFYDLYKPDISVFLDRDEGENTYKSVRHKTKFNFYHGNRQII